MRKEDKIAAIVIALAILLVLWANSEAVLNFIVWGIILFIICMIISLFDKKK